RAPTQYFVLCRVPRRDGNVVGGVYIDQVIARVDSGFEGSFESAHALLETPLLLAMQILQPGSAMIDGNENGTIEVNELRFLAYASDKLFRCETRIPAIEIDLVQRSRELNRRIIPFRRSQSGTDHCA